MHATLALLVMMMAMGGCATPAESAGGGGFTVQAADGQLVLRNATQQTVHYTAIEEETAARVDLHFDPTQWPSVPPGGEVRVSYTAVMGYIRGSERAIVHWWTAAGSYGTPLRVELR